MSGLLRVSLAQSIVPLTSQIEIGVIVVTVCLNILIAESILPVSNNGQLTESR